MNKVKEQLLKVAEPEEKETISDNINLLNQQQIVIRNAIDKVKEAEEQGEKKGLAEAERMIKKQENQSFEESEADMKHLQTKFEKTSVKAKSIIANFQKVHSDLQALQQQYAQQDNTTAQTLPEEERELSSKLIQLEQSNLALKMQSKQR